MYKKFVCTEKIKSLLIGFIMNDQIEITIKLESIKQTTGHLLDLGCGEGNRLFTFKDSTYTSLTGIDHKGDIADTFIRYLVECNKAQVNYDNQTISFVANKKANRTIAIDSFYKDFRNILPHDFGEMSDVFSFCYAEKFSIENFYFEPNRYSVIIMEDVLHFYCNDKIETYLAKIQQGLSPRGVLVVIVNHLENTDIINENVIRKSKYEYWHRECKHSYFLFDNSRVKSVFKDFHLLDDISSFDHNNSFELYFTKK